MTHFERVNDNLFVKLALETWWSEISNMISNSEKNWNDSSQYNQSILIMTNGSKI
jgi:hypothetical protein